LAPALLIVLGVAGCAHEPTPQEEKAAAQEQTPAIAEGEPAKAVPAPQAATRPEAETGSDTAPLPARSASSPAVAKPSAAVREAAQQAARLLKPASFAELPGWAQDDHASALAAFVLSCEALANREAWRNVCAAARAIPRSQPAAARRFFETQFRPYRALHDESGAEGLITGYYEPLLHGSRAASGRFRFPLYSVPDDLLVIDLAEVHPELKGRRVRGRLEGSRVIPYYSRAQITVRPVLVSRGRESGTSTAPRTPRATRS
jgi:membrane-bound lytic murein transglycosylase A